MEKGFSLVELSIVLVILGLLVGGVMSGQSLIKAAELRSVTTEMQQWQAAVNTFRNKYMAVPGDFNKAGQFWGYVNTGGTGGNCSNPATDTGTGTQTCDGDGDGTVDTNGETYRFWQHLANAGMINGNFTGVAGSGGVQHSVIDGNVPRAKYGNAGWGIRYLPNNGGTSGSYFAYDYGHVLQIGASTTNNLTHGAIFTPEEAWNIDTKVDDGLPARGRVVSSQTTNCTNATSHTDSGAEYALSQSGQNCALNFSKVF